MPNAAMAMPAAKVMFACSFVHRSIRSFVRSIDRRREPPRLTGPMSIKCRRYRNPSAQYAAHHARLRPSRVPYVRTIIGVRIIARYPKAMAGNNATLSARTAVTLDSRPSVPYDGIRDIICGNFLALLSDNFVRN